MPIPDTFNQPQSPIPTPSLVSPPPEKKSRLKLILVSIALLFLLISIPATVFLVQKVQEIRKRAAPPLLPDLGITFIERTPRFNFDGEKKWPSEGESVTFIAHIRNRGSASSGSFTFEWLIDNNKVVSQNSDSLSPGEEITKTYQWTWNHTVSPEGKIQGSHTVEFRIDPQNQIAEISENNNNLKDYTQALGVGFWVEKSVYNFFNQYQFSYCQDKTCAGSNSWEDWAQRQIKEWNRLFETATPPILEKVRMDKITIVENCTLPLAGGVADNQPDINEKTVDLMWGFTSAKVGVIACSRDEADGNKNLYQNNPHFQNIEYPLMHELSHARYLVDLYNLDIPQGQVLVNHEGKSIAGSSLLPIIRDDKVYFNQEQRIMGGGKMEEGYDQHSIGALNRIAGQRARGGNYNSPSVIGEYLNDLPGVNRFHFLDRQGRPLPKATIAIYQRNESWVFDDGVDLQKTADNDGFITLGRNPFGPQESSPISPTLQNGILLFKIQSDNQVDYRFQEVTDFNLAFWRGEKESANYQIKTNLLAALPTITPTQTPTPTPTTPVPTSTPTPTPGPTATPTPKPTATPTPGPTATPTPKPVAVVTLTPTPTPVGLPVAGFSAPTIGAILGGMFLLGLALLLAF